MVVRDRYTDEKIIITEHAFGRAKRRLQLRGNSLVRFARKALMDTWSTSLKIMCY